MQILKGAPVAEALNAQFCAQISELAKKGTVPKLAIVRVGEREDDIAYERGITRRFLNADAEVLTMALPQAAEQGELERAIAKLNKDALVHGIILLRPLPKQLSLESLKYLISPAKDVDCMGAINQSLVFEGNPEGYPPPTAQAVLEMLDFYKISPAGKKVVIIGRSLVVGKPLSMLLLARDATVTICHTKTQELASECKRADILVASAGAAGLVGADFVHAGQIVIDVGINMVDGKLCGDVDFAAVEGKVAALTPVPGGVGTVTSAVLLKHTIQSINL